MKREATSLTTMESPRKAAEPAEEEGENSMGEAVGTGAPTWLVLDPQVEAGAEWVAGVEETTAQQPVVAIIRNPRVKEPVEGMVKIGPSITQPGPETAVKPAVRAQSMKKSPRGGGREALRRAARVEQAMSATRTKKTARNRTPRMALITPLAV